MNSSSDIAEGLKPCPFCGGEADAISAVGETWVRCMTCEASGPSSSNDTHSITAWNTRPPTLPADGAGSPTIDSADITRVNELCLSPGSDEMLLEAVSAAIKRAMVKGWGYRDLGRAAIKVIHPSPPVASSAPVSGWSLLDNIGPTELDFSRPAPVSGDVEGLDLDVLEKVAREATPGHWHQAGLPWFQTGAGVLAGSPDPHIGYMIADTEPWDGDREEYAENGGQLNIASADADAAHIATFDPPTVLKLISTLRAQQAKITEQDAEIERLKADAERFRALMRCGRIKMQGSSGVDPHTLERNGNNVHFGAEFWPEPPKPEYAHLGGGDKSTAWGRACLRHLADAVLEHEARQALSESPNEK